MHEKNVITSKLLWKLFSKNISSVCFKYIKIIFSTRIKFNGQDFQNKVDG